MAKQASRDEKSLSCFYLCASFFFSVISFDFNGTTSAREHSQGHARKLLGPSEQIIENDFVSLLLVCRWHEIMRWNDRLPRSAGSVAIHGRRNASSYAHRLNIARQGSTKANRSSRNYAKALVGSMLLLCQHSRYVSADSKSLQYLFFRVMILFYFTVLIIVIVIIIIIFLKFVR